MMPDSKMFPCPTSDLIWSAACGELSSNELGPVLDHAALCPACVAEWRMSRRLAQAAGLAHHPWSDRLRETGVDLSWRAQRAVEAVVQNIARPFGRSEDAAKPVGIPIPVYTLAALALLMIPILFGILPEHRNSQLGAPSASAPVYRGVVPLVKDGGTLPRDAFVLRWEHQENAIYHIRVTTLNLDVVYTVRDLEAAEVVVPSKNLSDLPAGTELRWRLSVVFPDGRRPSFDESFRVILQ